MKLIDAGAPVSPIVVGFYRVAIAAPFLCLATWWLGGSSRAPDRGGRGRLLVAGLAMGASRVSYFAGVARTRPVFGERLGPIAALGATLLPGAVLGLTLRRRRARPPPPAGSGTPP